MHSRHLCNNGLQERSVLAQNQNIGAHSTAYPSTVSVVAPDAALQSRAESAHTPNEVAHSKCASGVYSGVPLPPDLVAIMKVWPALPEALRAGILSMVQAKDPPTPRSFATGAANAQKQ